MKQRADGDCLAACASMVLDYYGLSLPYWRLIWILSIKRNMGTPFHNIQNLQRRKMNIVYKQRGTLELLYTLLINERPIITGIQAGELPYWPINMSHAVVVAGMDKEHIYLHDPGMDFGPMPVSIGDFDLAWLGHNEVYAILEPK
ncbi:MAG: C39 family peptidase [Chloroflexota bacterium]